MRIVEAFFLGILATCLSVGERVLAEDRFPFVIPGDDARSGTATDFSYLSPQPAGEDGFVRIVDGRLHTQSGRLRLWGMNLCFGANFPTREDARKVAAHLAKLGINAVRIHHHDLRDAPDGIWKAGLVGGERVFDKEMIDRLDYFLAKLHQHGIYADLNLHCSRQLKPQEGFPDHSRSGAMEFNKYVLYFEPRMKAELKKFCRAYLLHKNPYRSGRTRVDDPGVALIELTNENAFSTKGAGPPQTCQSRTVPSSPRSGTAGSSGAMWTTGGSARRGGIAVSPWVSHWRAPMAGRRTPRAFNGTPSAAPSWG